MGAEVEGTDWLDRSRPIVQPEILNLLKRQALEARLEGVSHKGFKVGVAILATRSKGEESDMFTGSNYKPHPGSVGPRSCAEDEAMAKAMMRGYTVIKVMVIAAHRHSDDYTSRDWGALVPCGKTCRPMFAKSVLDGGMFRHDTVVYSMRLRDGEDDFVEHTIDFTIGQLLRTCGAPGYRRNRF
jgi:cytidine deaminase